MIRSNRLTISNGNIRGIFRTSQFSGAKFISFLGIPYAMPPTDENRFKPPQPIQNWSGTYDATYERDDCFQFSYYENRFVGSEDCLYLNVHTPRDTLKEWLGSKAVIVMIHGGALLWGSGNENVNGSPEYVMHKDIVYVCINYRLHVLGFLNLQLPDCPGNMALKDIVMALNWVQQNIKYFGGNENNVTLFGYSSGATIVHALLMSPLAKGLFHKVIMLGMNLFHPFIFPFEKNPVDLAFKFGECLGYKGRDRKELLKFLKKQSSHSILMAFKELNDFAEYKYKKISPSSPFTLSLEEVSDGAFLTKYPTDLIRNMITVPVIYGCCEMENVFALLPRYEHFLKNNFETVCRLNPLSWFHGLDSTILNQIEKQIQNFYLRENMTSTMETHARIKAQDDVTMLDFYQTVANVISDLSPSTSVYIYRFEYEGNLNWMSSYIKPMFPYRIEGTFHSDDVHYWMCKNPKPNSEDSRMVEIITYLFTNFAKTGNPNGKGAPVEWKPTSFSSPYYLKICQDLRLCHGRPNEGRLLYWEEVKKRASLKSEKLD